MRELRRPRAPKLPAPVDVTPVTMSTSQPALSGGDAAAAAVEERREREREPAAAEDGRAFPTLVDRIVSSSEDAGVRGERVVGDAADDDRSISERAVRVAAEDARFV